MIRLVLPCAVAVGLLCISPAAWASGWACWAQAARRYDVPVELMYAIAMVETHNRAHIVSPRNANGTVDIGLMQINSAWLPTLRRYGITAKALYANACLNLNVGAWILRKTLSRYGFNWRGIGAYNASSPRKQAVYARRVETELRAIRQGGY